MTNAPRDLTEAEITDLREDLQKSLAAPMPPQTVAELEVWIKEHFHCMDGPPMAYFDIPTPGILDGPIRLRYVTLCFTAKGRDHQRALVLEMYSALLSAALSDEQQLLFWRRHFRYEEGKLLGTREWLSRISCRLVIPGYTFASKPEGDQFSTVEVQ